MRAWMIRAGQSGDREQAALELGRVIAGWSETGDLSAFTDRESLRDYLRAVYPSASRALVGNWTGQLWRFLRVISEGDLVVLPLKGEARELVLGRIAGPYSFDETAARGFRHVRPVEWLRTIPRTDLGSDLLDSLGALLTIAELRRHDAAARLEAVMDGGADPGWLPEGAHSEELSSKDDLIARAIASAASSPLNVSIRQLLQLWGTARRTDSTIAIIEQDLADSGLATVPRISEGWLDNIVAITAIRPTPEDPPLLGELEAVAEDAAVPVSVTISTLQSATSGVVSVQEGDALVKAVTLMLQFDFSQLAVLNPQGDITGVVSWETIGKARLGKTNPTLHEATFPARTVTVEADLLGVVAEVSSRDYVFVRAVGSHKPVGIVTVADLSDQFYIMARPFALVEEVERRLRRCTDERVPVAAMKAAAGNKGAQILGAANLTMGAYKHLYKDRENFEYLGWALDHTTFFDLLSAVHALRNNLMHFSTDPLGEQELAQAQALLHMLRVVDPRP